MNKVKTKTIYKILIILLSLVVSVEIGLFIWVLVAKNDTVREVTLESEGDTVEQLSFTAGNFFPGDVKEYTVLVHGDEGGEFDFTFTASPTSQGTLWKYLNFEIIYGEQSKAASLAAMFDGTAFEFNVTMDGQPAKFTVRYKMPKEVGNEAENLEANFSLILSAKKK